MYVSDSMILLYFTQIQGLEEKKEEPLWKAAVYSKSTTGIVKDGQWKCILSLELPKKKGRYICKYHCRGITEKGHGKYCYQTLKLGDKQLMTNDGTYMPKRECSDIYGLPLSGSVVVELSGQETDQQRKLGLWYYGTSVQPSGMMDPFIEAYEI